MREMADGVENIGLDIDEERTSRSHGRDDRLLVDRGTRNEVLRPTIEVLIADEELTQRYDNDSSKISQEAERRLCKHLWDIVDLIIARRGVIFALFSAFLFSAQGLFMKIVTRLNAFQFVAFNMAVLLLGSLLGILFKRATLPKQPSNYLWIFLSGMGVSVAVTAFAVAVRYLDVSDAVALAYSSLIFICILSWVILKEPLRLFDFVFSLMALAGVFFIARPNQLFGQSHQDSNSNRTDYLIGVAFGIGSAVGLSLRTIAYKKVNQMEIDKFFPIFALGLVGLLGNVVLCTVLKQWIVPQPRELIYGAGSGLSFFFGHIFIVMSLKLETATIVSIILTFEISFSFLLQFLFRGVSPVWTSYVGSLLLIFASVGITLYKNRTVTDIEISDQVQDSS